MVKSIPRPEYPRPQLVRKNWINLNGPWNFSIDFSNSGIDKKIYKDKIDDQTIIVPFCPESKLSGIEYTDFMSAVWYQRKIEIPTNWKNKRIKLHFGAVDYHAIVWVNGVEVGQHKGGYTPFWFDITNTLSDKENIVTVYAKDDAHSFKQPSGKQSSLYNSYGCYYTRTTGIWQTVWIEAVNEICVENIKLTPLLSKGAVEVEIITSLPTKYAEVSILYKEKDMAKEKVYFDGNRSVSIIELKEKHLWTAGKGDLYDIKIKIGNNNSIKDEVTSYFGLRSITWNKKGMILNGEYIYQRLVLDQGFYPDGVYTAPKDEALKNDIKLSMAMGFNGARLHEKIFEPRYLYWADKLGYLCWGEHANWGLDITTMKGLKHFLPEWIEAINRDYSHPSIVGWCPFNETWNTKEGIHIGENGTPQEEEVLRFVYLTTKQMDKTRPVIDTSGNFHVITDIFDIHSYVQDPKEFKKLFKINREGGVYITFPKRQAKAYKNQPYFVSEYGGIKWSENEKGWGYGEGPSSKEQFIKRYEGLTSELLQNVGVCAFCYTQLYDVEQEVNGLYNYDRKAKFDPKVIAKINKQIAAIEK